MIASSYKVQAYDRNNNRIAEVKAYSFDEAYFDINELREKFCDEVVKFEIALPDEEEEATQSIEALKMQEQKSSGKKVTRCADCFYWYEGIERCGYCNKHEIFVGQDDGCTMGEVDQ
ncbi:MAG: hypothetical protein IJS71_08460 [Clostridia bacterium]|nr:hypothetical protein [Clostridia bacterium]